MGDITDIPDFLEDTHEETIEQELTDEERFSDIAEAVRVVSIEFARNRREVHPSAADVEDILKKLCFLPYMPKKSFEKEIREIREQLFQKAADNETISAIIPPEIDDGATTLLDFLLPYPTPTSPPVPIHDIVESTGLNNLLGYIGQNNDEFYLRVDPSSQGYAKPVLVDADWVEKRLDDFQSDDPILRLVEVDVDTEAYEEAHAPGAIGFNWETQLQDQVHRDILAKDDFEELLGSHGIIDDSTVVLYGDNANWFAAYAYWQFKYYGHDDVRLLDGGRDYWIENDYPTTTEVPEFSDREYTARGPFEGIRAYREDVEKAIDRGIPLVDVRSPEEFRGEILAPPGLQETAQRGGHVPGAKNISWAAVTNDDGTFKTRDEIEQLYTEEGIDGDETTVAYCRIGERSSVAWFALHELLGYEDAINYDGSWTEWGNLVGAPIETGDAE